MERYKNSFGLHKGCEKKCEVGSSTRINQGRFHSSKAKRIQYYSGSRTVGQAAHTGLLLPQPTLHNPSHTRLFHQDCISQWPKGPLSVGNTADPTTKTTFTFPAINLNTHVPLIQLEPCLQHTQ